MLYQKTRWFTIAATVGLSIVVASSPAAAAPAPEVAVSSGPVTDVDSGKTVHGQARAAGLPAGPNAINASRIVSTWLSGTIAVGASKTWRWNNANPLTVAYEVGFMPIGASTTASCAFEVTRSWYVQQWGGEREFWFTAKNVGGIACAAEVVLASVDPFTSWSTGGINPGASTTTHWNNANPLDSAHLVGLSPNGATNTSTCQFEVTRTWYVQQPGGEREFYFTVKNVGTIACMADIRLAKITGSQNLSASPTPIAIGQTRTISFYNPNPPIKVFRPGLSPKGATGVDACQIEIIRRWYGQEIHGSNTDRVLHISYKNVGNIACSVHELYTRAA